MKLDRNAASQNEHATCHGTCARADHRRENEGRISQELVSTIWDVQEALQRADGDPVFLRELAELFLLRSQQLLDELEQRLAAEDLVAVRGVAHALKGSAAELAAKELVQIAGQLEATVRGEDVSMLTDQVQRLREAATRLGEVLRTWLSS
jgi:HPt (histidine-containing phosphotransfer) domain-containing protein